MIDKVLRSPYKRNIERAQAIDSAAPRSIVCRLKPNCLRDCLSSSAQDDIRRFVGADEAR